MANPLRKTMVYLGLADEDLDYEDATAHAPAARRPRRSGPASPRPACRTARP